MTIKAELKWTDGMQFVARTDNGPAVVMDTPENQSGASPMEMMLMGTAGCTAMDVVSILQKKRAQLKGLSINISGERADAYPKRYTHIHVEFIVKGKQIKPSAVKQAIDLSVEKYCGAMASLNADITHSFKISDVK